MTLRKTLLASLAVLALAAAPALAGAGGNGHGGGNGNGGNGNGGGNAGGNGNSGATHGNSASAPGHNKGTDTASDDSSPDNTTTAATPNEQNIHAKLGRLNSLQRNINAYMHSKSKKFAGVQAYVTQAAAAQNAQAALDAANAKLAADQATLAGLQAQLATAQADPTTPPQTITDLENQIAALTTTIGTTDAQAITDAQTAVANNPPPTDASLDTALADMANKPVDQEVTNWAKGVLAGKIDQAAAAMTTP